MPKNAPLFDVNKAKLTIEKGRRSKWWRRRGSMKRGFHYAEADGQRITDQTKLERIKSLVIPPAWRHVRINSYLKAATAPEYSAKDLRTWAGTLLAAIELAELGTADEEIQIKKNVVKAVRNVAEQLGNTPTVCLGSYIHPAVLRVYENGRTLDDFAPRRKRKIRKIQEDFEPEEKALMKLLTES